MRMHWSGLLVFTDDVVLLYDFIVILYLLPDNKIIEFIQDNGIRTTKNDSTTTFQSKINKALEKTKPSATLKTKGN
jgi:hypothetical protein